jgi:hypothetical protein
LLLFADEEVARRLSGSLANACFLVAQPNTFVYNSRKEISMGKKDKPTEQQSSADDPASESTDDDTADDIGSLSGAALFKSLLKMKPPVIFDENESPEDFEDDGSDG